MVTVGEFVKDAVHQTASLSVVWTVGRVDTAVGVGLRQTFVLHLNKTTLPKLQRYDKRGAGIPFPQYLVSVLVEWTTS